MAPKPLLGQCTSCVSSHARACPNISCKLGAQCDMTRADGPWPPGLGLGLGLGPAQAGLGLGLGLGLQFMSMGWGLCGMEGWLRLVVVWRGVLCCCCCWAVAEAEGGLEVVHVGSASGARFLLGVGMVAEGCRWPPKR